MDVIKIYKYSLFLPLIVPIIFSPAVFFLRLMPETLAVVALTIVYSGLFGGIPYLILIAILFPWMRDKNEQQIRKALIFSPLFMIGIFVVGFSVLNLNIINEPFSEFVVGIISASLPILIFGYSYVLLVFGLVRLLRK